MYTGFAEIYDQLMSNVEYDSWADFYAALMAAMLRSQNIPTKLVVGYVGDVYHAWISTYTVESGWVDGIIFFDGTNWKLMDPTFASNANSSAEIMQYIGNSANYKAKYLY